MARSVSVCAPLGLLFFIQLSAGCSANSGVNPFPPGSNGGQGTGSTGNNGGVGNVSSNGGAGGLGYNVGPSTSTLSTDVVQQLLKSCGNGTIDANEQCDDGNKTGGDGCSKTCQLENPNEWSCPTAGQPCVSLAVCGDGKLSSQEACDDGNTVSGDGCSADCTAIENGWQCRMPGKPCVPKCGDGQMVGTEQCDDGNTISKDGFSSTCIIEPGYQCSGTPSTCTQIVCGDGVVQGSEACDDGPNNGLFLGDGTGCSKTCTKEPTCRVNGVTQACSTACGDGNIDPGEQCDDGNLNSGDGCSSTCQSEAGFNCNNSQSSDATACTTGSGNCLKLPIILRDFDGQQVATKGHPDFFYYGASVNGKKTVCVPNASLGATETLTWPTASGQTCGNADQTPLLQGMVASTLGADGTPTVVLAKAQNVPCRFTDWDYTGVIDGVTGTITCTSSGDGSQMEALSTTVNVIQSADTFNEWYHDTTTPTSGTKVISQLELAANGTTPSGAPLYQFTTSGGRTVYDDIHDIFLRDLPANPTHPAPNATAVSTLSSGFFPLEADVAAAGRSTVCNLWPYWLADKDGTCTAQGGNDYHSAHKSYNGSNMPTHTAWEWDSEGWWPGNTPPTSNLPGGYAAPVTGIKRNSYFTSVVRYLFVYNGGEVLAFDGDDDVWVYLNGHLVLDLGGPHERLIGQVSLTNDTTAAYTISRTKPNVAGAASSTFVYTTVSAATGNVTGLGLTKGQTYEIAVFHADQHPRESNYKLTLTGFTTTRTNCAPFCGDGVTTAGEECDLGTANNTGAYNGCNADCTYGPYCGDGTLDNPPEQCDLGAANGATYGKDGCTSDCKTPPYCGDGIIDGLNGEECDTAGVSQTCDASCKLITGPIN